MGNFTDVSAMGATPDKGDTNYSLFIFVPVLAVLCLLTIGSNTILLILIGRSWKLCTSLNILLMSISSLNVLSTFSQLTLLASIIRKEWILGKGACHLNSFTLLLFSYTTTLVHLLISRDRYHICKDPLSWKNNRKRAWLISLLLWVGVGLTSMLDRFLHVKDFQDYDHLSDYTLCYWPPTTAPCANPLYLFAIHAITFIAFMVISATIYYNYVKIHKDLRGNEKTKEFQMKLVSSIARNKRQKTTSERAATSLAIAFTVHFVSQFPSHLYYLVRYGQTLSPKQAARLLPQAGEITLTCLGFVTAISPLILMFVNGRYKQHVRELFRCKCDPEDDRDWLADHLVAEKSPPLSQPTPKLLPNDPSVFLGSGLAGRSDAYRVAGHRQQKSAVTFSRPSPIDFDLSQGLSRASAAGTPIQINNFIFP